MKPVNAALTAKSAASPTSPAGNATKMGAARAAAKTISVHPNDNNMA